MSEFNPYRFTCKAKKLDSDEWVTGFYVFQRKRRGAFGQIVTAMDSDRHYIITASGDSYEINPTTLSSNLNLVDDRNNVSETTKNTIDNEKINNILKRIENDPFNQINYCEYLSDEEKELLCDKGCRISAYNIQMNGKTSYLIKLINNK